MRRATLFAIALFFTTHFTFACSEYTTIMPTTIAYPETTRGDVVEEHFGQAIAQLLERDKLLIQSDSRYLGKLAFPYSYGVVFANITRKQFEAAEGLCEVFEPNLVFCKDEIYETVDPAELGGRQRFV